MTPHLEVPADLYRLPREFKVTFKARSEESQFQGFSVTGFSTKILHFLAFVVSVTRRNGEESQGAGSYSHVLARVS